VYQTLATIRAIFLYYFFFFLELSVETPITAAGHTKKFFPSGIQSTARFSSTVCRRKKEKPAEPCNIAGQPVYSCTGCASIKTMAVLRFPPLSKNGQRTFPTKILQRPTRQNIYTDPMNLDQHPGGTRHSSIA